MTRGARGTRVALGAAVALLGVGASVVGPAGPALARDEVSSDCTGIQGGQTYEDTFATDQESAPLGEMEVDRATARLAQLGKQPGEGVVVAVLDSGIADAAGLPVIEHVPAGALMPPAYYHGTAVAGLIAGPARPEDQGGAVGIAPAAQLLDVQVYDDPAADPEVDTDRSPITVDNIVAGLDAVIARMPTMNIKVVTIALDLPFDDRRIKLAIARLWKLGAVVVAPTGNRPTSDGPSALPPAYAEHQSGEDVAGLVHPADYRNVLAVNSSMTGMPAGTDPYAYVLENSETEIAAPTANGVSYSPVGGTCTLAAPATSWAAAEVSGALALLQSYYDEPPALAVARLLNTASGRTDVPNTLVGAGEVQLLDALTRPLQMDDKGDVLSQGEIEDQPQQLSAPQDPPDLLASTREDAVWWGLLGGGLLLLALLLRPVLARRRRVG